MSAFLRRKGVHAIAAGMDEVMDPLRGTLAFADSCCGVAQKVLGVYAGKGWSASDRGLFSTAAKSDPSISRKRHHDTSDHASFIPSVTAAVSTTGAAASSTSAAASATVPPPSSKPPNASAAAAVAAAAASAAASAAAAAVAKSLAADAHAEKTAADAAAAAVGKSRAADAHAKAEAEAKAEVKAEAVKRTVDTATAATGGQPQQQQQPNQRQQSESLGRERPTKRRATGSAGRAGLERTTGPTTTATPGTGGGGGGAVGGVRGSDSMDAWVMASSVGDVGGGGGSDAGGGFEDRARGGARSPSVSSGAILDNCALFDARLVEAAVGSGSGAVGHPLHPGGLSGVIGMLPRHDVPFGDIGGHHPHHHLPRTPPLHHQHYHNQRATFEIDSDRRDIFSPFILSPPPSLDDQSAGGGDSRSRGSAASAVSGTVAGGGGGSTGGHNSGGGGGGGGGGGRSSIGNDSVYRAGAGEDARGGVGRRGAMLNSVDSSPIDAGPLSETSPSRRVTGVVTDGLGDYTDPNDANLLSGMLDGM